MDAGLKVRELIRQTYEAFELKILKGVEGISFSYFNARDVVRHPMVQRIVLAYDKATADEGSDASRA